MNYTSCLGISVGIIWCPVAGFVINDYKYLRLL